MTGEQRRRVELLRGGLRYARLFRACGTFQRSGDVYAGAAGPGDLQELDDLARLWKKAGIRRIREGEDFDFTLQKLRSRLRQHTVEWLRDERQAVAVVPGLGGRLVEWQVSGWPWLAPPGPDSTWSLHPFSGGYCESVILGMYASRGWGEAYRAAWQGQRLRLSARIGRYLRITRWLWLEDGALHLRSRLHNTGTVEVPCGWGASIQYALPAEAQVVFRAADGQQVSAGEGEALVFTGEKAPRGAWEIRTAAGSVRHSIRGQAVERFSLGGQGEADWRTRMGKLAPGESLQVEQVIRVG